jgi:lipid-A-disaccharide synthase
MVQAGLDLDFDLTQLAVVGVTEVLPKLRDFFRLADQAEGCFRRGEVDAVVLVDFPGFNWHIAKRAKKYGLPVTYYLPPQIWAWGSWRVQKMKRWVDHVLCNLPFERDWFAEQGVPATFVGHPFFDLVADAPLDQRFLKRWETREQVQIAVLPGSRNHEVHRMWPLQLQVIRRLVARFPDIEFLVAALTESHADWCREHMTPEDRRLPIQILSGKTSEIIELADCALMKSGSVSLEMMARHTPAVVMYHVNHLTYFLGKLLVRCKSISLPNLIADEPILPEFVSYGSAHSSSARHSVERSTEAMSRLIGDPVFRKARQHRLQELSNEFAVPGASERAASWIASQMGIESLQKAA